MGAPLYGQSFSLAERTQRGLNAPTYGGGEAGEATRARGFLSYYEVSIFHFPLSNFSSRFYRYLLYPWTITDLRKNVEERLDRRPRQETSYRPVCV